jgi:hypothetical protein
MTGLLPLPIHQKRWRSKKQAVMVFAAPNFYQRFLFDILPQIAD